LLYVWKCVDEVESIPVKFLPDSWGPRRGLENLCIFRKL
jgi:hypothetical protein